jgi:hypothetical protein
MDPVTDGTVGLKSVKARGRFLSSRRPKVTKLIWEERFCGLAPQH